MNEIQKKTAKAILQICRRNGVTIDDLIISAIQDSTISGMEQSDESIEKQITNLLKELGVPVKLEGYHYIRYSVMYALQNEDAIKGVTKILYPAVAEKFKTKPSNVERAIRHAIEVAWERGNINFMDDFFGNTIDSKRGNPSSSEFIAAIVDHIANKV